MSPTLQSCALVRRYVPEFDKRWQCYARPVGTSWRVDETYIRVRGRWTYLYRAIDKQGLAVDFLLSEKRDIAAAERFFTRAVGRRGTPETITLDGHPATHAAVAELKKGGVLRPGTKVWTSKYLNNLVEQDHRRVKQHIYPMLGFKNFRNAAVTLGGIGLAQQMRKGQYNISAVIASEGARVPRVWEAVLAGWDQACKVRDARAVSAICTTTLSNTAPSPARCGRRGWRRRRPAHSG